MKFIHISLPLALALLAPVSAAQVELSVGDVDLSTGTMAIYMENQAPVAGFQFTVTEGSGGSLDMTGFGFGGTAGTASFVVQGGASGVVLGFSFALTTIPIANSGPQLLTYLNFSGNPASVCLSGSVISDPLGNSMPSVVAPCLGLPITDCDGNGVDDGVDIFHDVSKDQDGDGILDACQMLIASPASLSLASGGVQSFSLSAGPSHAGELYLLVGSSSGTTPGLPLGSLTLPLNYDWYMDFSLQSANQGPFGSTFAFLDLTGKASASLTLPPFLSPTLLGVTFHHAYVTLDLLSAQVTSVSNPAPLLLLL